MATYASWTTRVAAVLVAAVAIATVGACTPRPNGPASAAEAFFAALAGGDTASAAELTNDPRAARETLNAAWVGLQALYLEAQVLGARHAEDTGNVAYRYTWHLPKQRTWTYEGQLPMVRNEGRWQIGWSATALHPKLGDHQGVELRADVPRRASVNEISGTDVLVPGFLYRYQLDAAKAGLRLGDTARAVAAALRGFDDALGDPQQLAEQASSLPRPLELITLRKADSDRVEPVIGSLPGVVVISQAELLPTDDEFAPALMAEVRKAVVDRLDGAAGWRVVSLNHNGAEIAVLHEVAPVPAPSITITLDRTVQRAAQNAVNSRGGKAVLVALRPSSGEILAVAQNPAADADGLIATTGLYPPGSTFKMVTAGAAMQRDMVSPDTPVGCPGEVDIGNRSVPNQGRFDLGVVSLARAFASSCNTTFAELASRMPPRALNQVSMDYGIGVDYLIDGITTVTGMAPATVDLAERTEDGFGQGKVLASPFGIALVAATVAAGKTPVPQLIQGSPTTVSSAGAPVPSAVLDGLRAMMRLTVTDGTARVAADCGPIFGKTGEAEFDGGSHSWFAGYRGDLAFAALIVGGGSSENAVTMTKLMFDSLPDDFLA